MEIYRAIGQSITLTFPYLIKLKEFSMVTIIDLNMTGIGHFEFNKNIINRLIKNDSTIFYGERKLVSTLQNELEGVLEINSFYFPEANKKIKLLIREILAIAVLLKIFFTNIKYGKEQKIYFLSIIPLAHLYLKFLNLFFSYDITVFLHGELEAFNKKRGLPSFKYYYIFACKAIRIWNSNVEYVVLGESIYRNLNKIVRNKNIKYFDHPYTYTKKVEDKPLKKIITFGIVGKAIIGEKKSHLIFKLASEINALNSLVNKSRFKIVGSMSKDVLNYSNQFVEYINEDKMLKIEDFENGIKDLDFILFFYDSDSYKFTASGAFFDCVKFEVPILGIQNDFFNYYQEKYGEIGFLVTDFNELVCQVQNILNIPYLELNYKIGVFKNNLKKMKSHLIENNEIFFKKDKL